MSKHTWQNLLILESRDIISDRFFKIHGRTINQKRAKEIIASSRQAREFFRNSRKSDFSVKPLLTFYGVASLSRALTLLCKRDGGEETLSKGHGLETVNWTATLNSQENFGLGQMQHLKVRTCNGLLADLIKASDNTIPIHVNSSGVDWHVSYKNPKLGDEIRFSDVLSRLPDVRNEYKNIGQISNIRNVSSMTFSRESGFRAQLYKVKNEITLPYFAGANYIIKNEGSTDTIEASLQIFENQLPQFIHAYVDTTFKIPSLHLTSPISEGNYYSQIAITYIVAYILGMLARYFPTHWQSLSHGAKGDGLWPVFQQAHRSVEKSFPLQCVNFIDYKIDNS